MKIKDMSKEELQLLSYTDLTYLILKEKGSMNTPSLFKTIADLLSYDENEYINKIGDYYTSLTLDKRFVLLESNEWDIRDRHSVELAVDLDEDEDEEVDDIIDEDENLEEVEEESSEELDDNELLDDEELDDLTILTDEELDEE